MNALFSLEVPLWAVVASGAVVLLTRILGIQASWARLRSFGDPALLGYRRRRLREGLLGLLLGGGFALAVATLLPEEPRPADSGGIAVLVFDAEGWRARQTPFDGRYALAELMAGRVTEILAGRGSTPVAAVIHGVADGIGVPATRDLPGLLQRARALLVVQTIAATPADDTTLGATVRQARERFGPRSRICVVTSRRPAEVSDQLVSEPGTGEVFVAGVPGIEGDSGYGCLAGNESGYASVGAEELARLITAPAPEPHAAARAPLSRMQVLAAVACVLLLFEWMLRTAGRVPRPTHVG